MKKLLTLVAAVMCTTTAFSQTDSIPDTNTVVVQQDSMPPHTIEDFKNYSKIQLADIYLKEVVRVTSTLTTYAFDGVINNVPNTKYTQSKFKKVRSKCDSYNETLLNEYKEIVPYADKEDLIRAILYLKSL
jgi:hypothetical protein